MIISSNFIFLKLKSNPTTKIKFKPRKKGKIKLRNLNQTQIFPMILIYCNKCKEFENLIKSNIEYKYNVQTKSFNPENQTNNKIHGSSSSPHVALQPRKPFNKIKPFIIIIYPIHYFLITQTINYSKSCIFSISHTFLATKHKPRTTLKPHHLLLHLEFFFLKNNSFKRSSSIDPNPPSIDRSIQTIQTIQTEIYIFYLNLNTKIKN